MKFGMRPLLLCTSLSSFVLLLFLVEIAAKRCVTKCGLNCCRKDRPFCETKKNSKAVCSSLQQFAAVPTAVSPVERDLGNSNVDLKKIPRECLSIEYNVYYYATDHLFLVGVPTRKKKACPSLTFDSFFFKNSNSKKSRKAVSRFEEASTVSGSGALRLNKYHLKNLVNAFKKADPGQGPYDLAFRNCAGFILSMFEHLKIDVTEDIVQYTIRQLTNEKDLVRQCKEDRYMQMVMLQSGQIPAGNKKWMETLVRQFLSIYNPNVCPAE
eukprot:scaffold79760_cov57-Attheya_sp.AAC.6